MYAINRHLSGGVLLLRAVDVDDLNRVMGFEREVYHHHHFAGSHFEVFNPSLQDPILNFHSLIEAY